MLDAQWACSWATGHGKNIGQVKVRCETVAVSSLLALEWAVHSLIEVQRGVVVLWMPCWFSSIQKIPTLYVFLACHSYTSHWLIYFVIHVNATCTEPYTILSHLSKCYFLSFIFGLFLGLSCLFMVSNLVLKREFYWVVPWFTLLFLWVSDITMMTIFNLACWVLPAFLRFWMLCCQNFSSLGPLCQMILSDFMQFAFMKSNLCISS